MINKPLRIVAAFIGSLVLTALGAGSTVAEVPFTNGQRVLVLGDSITQNGHYVALAEAYLWATYPDRKIDLVSIGLSSETVSGMTEPVHPFPRPNVHERLSRALDQVKPDWVIACYGMNDGIYHPESSEIVEAYRAGISKLVDQVSDRGAKLILLTPPSFDISAPPMQAQLKKVTSEQPYGYQNPFVDYDQTLVRLGEIVKSFAGKRNVDRVIDVHQATDIYLTRVKTTLPDYAYGDGIHPPADGHLAMAVGLLAGLGCEPAKVQATLVHLTGLPPADQPAEATDEQRMFHKALLDRFSKRSAAYRKAVGFTAPMKVDALPVDEADQVAAQAEESLRQLIAARPRPASQPVYAAHADAAHKRWDASILELESLDKSQPDPDDAILIIGSSSVRLWQSIAADMAPYSVIQRGYGGARYSDLAVFAQRLITPHQYAALAVFVGNDVTGKDTDLSLDEIEKLARHVVEVSQSHQSEAPILLIEVTPTSSRLDAWPKIRMVNDRLREIALTTPRVYFVATAEYYLDADGKPIDDYFKSDRLHQNEQGYAVWAALIKRRLGEVLAAGGKAPLLPAELIPAELVAD